MAGLLFYIFIVRDFARYGARLLLSAGGFPARADISGAAFASQRRCTPGAGVGFGGSF